MKIWYSLLLLFLFSLIIKAQSDDHFILGHIHYINAGYEFDQNKYIVGIGSNLVFGMLNGGIEVSSWTSNKSSPIYKFNGYLGMGLINLIQIQACTNSTYRIRSDLVIFQEEFPYFGNWKDKIGHRLKTKRDGIVLSIMYERNFNDIKREIFSVGLGIYF